MASKWEINHHQKVYIKTIVFGCKHVMKLGVDLPREIIIGY